MIKATLTTNNCVAKSLSKEFNTLSNNEKIKTLIDDANSCCEYDELVHASPIHQNDFKSEDDSKKFVNTLSSLSKKESKDDINKAISELVDIAKENDIADYKIIRFVSQLLQFKKLAMSLYDFVAKYILKIPVASNKVKVSNTVDSKGAQQAAAANALGTKFNASNFVNTQHPAQAEIVNTAAYSIPVNAPQPKPTLTLEQKAEILKKHIKFVPGLHTEVGAAEVDILFKMVESPWLKNQLKTLKASCNPDFPELVELDGYEYDKNMYNYAFAVETVDPKKSIVILFSSMTFINQFNMPVNNICSYLEDTDKILESK